MDERRDIAVVGEQRFCIGFKLAGVQEFYTTDDARFGEQLDEAVNGGHSIVIVPERLFGELDERARESYQNMVDPVVVALGTDPASQGLRSKAKQALGIDIWAED